MRTQKTVNGVVHNYYYSGALLLAEEWNNHLMVFLYDANGSPVGIKYRKTDDATGTWSSYWYDKNLQGDVVAIYDDSGTPLVSYTYDAWGNHVVTPYNNGLSIVPIANNPIRYRGYYYDVDLGLYYLQTRYYDSNIGRFISPDHPAVITATPASLTDKNLYAYCDNNPVMRIDSGGEIWNWFIGGLIGGAVGLVSSLADEKDLLDVLWNTVTGAVSGAVAASGVGLAGQVAFNAGVGVLNSIRETASKDDATVGDYALNVISGGLSGVASGWLGGKGTASKHVSNSFWRMVASGKDDLTYYFSQIKTQAMRDGKKAIPGIFRSAIPSFFDNFARYLGFD